MSRFFSALFLAGMSIQLSAAVNAGSATDLNAAIISANSGGDNTINLTATINFGTGEAFTENFRPFNVSSTFGQTTHTITVDGGGNTILAADDSTLRGLFVYGGTVNLSNMTIQNTVAKGGNGGGSTTGGSSGGGGAGAGLGGGLYVASGATVNLGTVTFSSCVAQGGEGGGILESADNNGGGGGGGLFGNGGDGANISTVALGGGGGGFTGSGGRFDGGGGGAGGDGQDGSHSNTALAGTGGVNFAGVSATPPGQDGNGGSGGGGYLQFAATATVGGNGGTGGGGGGFQLANASSGSFGNGGKYGGGGGNVQVENTDLSLGNGGFGGGGGGAYTLGSSSGNGGFGGGGGASSLQGTGRGGYGGGDGDALGRGGGGAGLGGAIFIEDGGICVIGDGVVFSGTIMAIGGLGGSISSSGARGNRGSGAGQEIFIQDGGTVKFNISSTLTFSTAIESDNLNSGASGGLVKQGSGNLILTGTSTFLAPTIIQGGGGTLTLNPSSGNALSSNSVTNDAALALLVDQTVNNLSGSGDVLLGGNTLTVHSTSNGEISGIISGTGNFIKTGDSVLTLTGTNSYVGDTTISAGTLLLETTTGNALQSSSIANSGTLELGSNQTVNNIGGSGSIVLGSNTLTANTSTEQTIFGAISGSGGLTKTGTNNLILTINAAYTGTTTVSAGTLTLDPASGDALSSAAVVANGTVLLSKSQTLNNLSGTGTVSLGSNILTENSSSDTEFGGDISGTGELVKTGTGNLTLSGNTTYSGATTISAGTLTLDPSSGQALTSGSVSNGGTLALGASQTVNNLSGGGAVSLGSNTLTMNIAALSTVSGVISGAGSIVKTGAGSLTLTGVNTYAGTTTVNGGTLVVPSIDSLGDGTLTLNGGILSTNATGVTLSKDITIGASGGGISDGGFELNYSGQMTGAGTFTKYGSGTLTLSGTNAPGSTVVNLGRMNVTGSLTSDVSVTGILGGNGTITGNVTSDGGTVQPGTSIGTLTIDGDLTLDAGDTLAIEISPSDASKVVVTGTADIDGSTLSLIKQQGVYHLGSTYTILEAGDVEGVFGSEPTQLGGHSFSVVYNSTNIQLQLIGLSIPTTGLTGNNLVIANMLNTQETNSQYEELINIIGDHLTLSERIRALEMISPSRNAANPFVLQNLGGVFVDLVAQRQNATHFGNQETQLGLLSANGPLYAAAGMPRPSVQQSQKRNTFYASPFGNFAHEKAVKENPAFNMNTGGVLVGYDARREKGMIGCALAYAHTDNNQYDGFGKSHLNTYAGSVYGFYEQNNFFIEPLLWVGYSTIENRRNMEISYLSYTATADYHAWQITPHLAFGYDAVLPGTIIEPFVSGDLTMVWTSGYQETGAAELNVKQSDQYSSLVRIAFGMQFFQSIDFHEGVIGFREAASYTYKHLLGTGQVNAAFVDIGSGFTVEALTESQSLFTPGVELFWKAKSGAIVSLNYSGEFGTSYHSNQGVLTLGKEF